MAPLHIAARSGHDVVALRLIYWDVNVSAANRDGLTSLHVAAMNGQSAVAQWLIDGSADASAADKVRSVRFLGHDTHSP